MFATIQMNALAQNASLGQIKISNAFTWAAVPGQKVAAGFMRIENLGLDDALISAYSPKSNTTQLHEIAINSGVMKMVQLQQINLPTSSTTDLRPGGLHIMFMDLNSPIADGESIPVRLKFAKSGEVLVNLVVKQKGEKVEFPPVTQPITNYGPTQNSSNFISIDDSKNKCQDLGFKAGSEDFAKCVLQLSK